MTLSGWLYSDFAVKPLDAPLSGCAEAGREGIGDEISEENGG
jgi:hypothetical protein